MKMDDTVSDKGRSRKKRKKKKRKRVGGKGKKTEKAKNKKYQCKKILSTKREDALSHFFYSRFCAGERQVGGGGDGLVWVWRERNRWWRGVGGCEWEKKTRLRQAGGEVKGSVLVAVLVAVLVTMKVVV